LRRGPLIGGCLVGIAISWNIANVGPVATLLAHTYGIGLATIGLLTTVLFFGELPVMLPGGRAIDRHGAKRMGLLAVAVSLVANLLLMLSTAPAVALSLRGLAGLGVGLGFLAGAIYAQSGAGPAVALAGGIYGGVSLGSGGLALAIVPQLVPALSWRAPYASGAGVAALCMPLIALCPVAPGHRGHAAGPSFAALLSDRRLIRLGIILSVSFGFSVILGNWVVTLLERTEGMSRATAGAIGSLIFLLGIVGRPAGGMLVRAIPRHIRKMLAASFAAGALGTTLVVLSPGRAGDAVATGLIGIAAGIPFGAAVAGATRTHPEAAGAAVGAVNVYAITVIVCGAPLVGATLALPGNGRIGFGGLAALWLAATVVLRRLDT